VQSINGLLRSIACLREAGTVGAKKPHKKSQWRQTATASRRAQQKGRREAGLLQLNLDTHVEKIKLRRDQYLGMTGPPKR
jgi:hypothetical protein